MFERIVDNKKEADRWLIGLEYLIAKRSDFYLDRLDIWAHKEFQTFSNDSNDGYDKVLNKFLYDNN